MLQSDLNCPKKKNDKSKMKSRAASNLIHYSVEQIMQFLKNLVNSVGAYAMLASVTDPA